MSKKQEEELKEEEINPEEYIELPYNFLYWAGPIDDSMVNYFLETIRPEAANRIYLHSNGGETPAMQTILDIINSAPQQFEIVATCFLASNAFDLFLLAECDKFVLSGFYGGMVHLESFDTYTRDYEHPRRIGPLMKEYVSETREKYRNLYKKFLTKKELKAYDEGDDVFIKRKKCLKIFNAKELSIF